jgi:hypothetical protein
MRLANEFADGGSGRLYVEGAFHKACAPSDIANGRGTDENALARSMRSSGRSNTLEVRETDRVIAVRIKCPLGDWCRRREISKETRQR